MPVADVARRLMVYEPLLENLGASLPVDITSSTREEARYHVSTQMVDPALVLELAHQCVDPGEAGSSAFPTLEPNFCCGRVDGIFAGDELGVFVDDGWKMPRDEAAVRVVVCLTEAAPE